MKTICSLLLFCLLLPTWAGDAPARLKTYVTELAKEPRGPGNPEKLKKAAAYIEAQWQKQGLKVTRQPIKTDQGTFDNLIVSFGPSDAKRIVVGAHYDTAPVTPGADDNASGVAGIIELGHRLSQHKGKLTHRIDLVAFTLEEMPYFGTPQMGSMVYAASLKEKSVGVKLMLSLEMIGFYSDKAGSQRYPDPSLAQMFGDVGDYITLVGRQAVEAAHIQELYGAMATATDLRIVPLPAPEQLEDIGRSDHAAFWFHEYPAVLVTDSADFRNEHYHKPTDTPDKLDYVRMNKVIDGVFAYLTQ